MSNKQKAKRQNKPYASNDISSQMRNLGFHVTEEKSDKPSKKNNTIPKNSHGKNNGTQSNAYIGAPYNFVPYAKKVLPVQKTDMDVRGGINDGLLTGEICFELKAETPVFINDGTDQNYFYRNAWNKYAIPGSTMRGLIRSNAQILGQASIDEDIEDYRLMYRDVATRGPLAKHYGDVLGSKLVLVDSSKKPIGVLTKVKAGYIAKDEDGYLIYQTKVDYIKKDTLVDMNYYVLSERTIVSERKKQYKYFFDHPEVMQHKVGAPFRKKKQKNGRIVYEGEENKEYSPGYWEVSYEVKNLRNITQVQEADVLPNKGVLLASGKMYGKKALYIIPEIDKNKEPIRISKEDERAFRIDYMNKENTLKRFKNYAFFDLPEDGEVKPVFYIYLGGKLYFGFTPRLRLFYDYGIKDGFRQEDAAFDLVKSIFGCTGDDGSYRSKVSFSDVVLTSAEKMDSRKSLILASPKPTSYLDYLKQGQGTENTYNTDGFEIRGMKQYWLHKDIVADNSKNENQSVRSTLHPLMKGVEFAGKIRFRNLTSEELGLLCWSLRLEKNSWMNIGQAKAYGYGAISVHNIILRVLDYSRAYDVNGNIELEPFGDPIETTDYIDDYKAYLAKTLGVDQDKLVDKIFSDFFAIKDSTRIPDEDRIRYMSIDNREYQNRKRPLQTVQDVLKKQ